MKQAVLRIGGALSTLLSLVVMIAACASEGSPAAVDRIDVVAGYDGLLFDSHAHLDEDGLAPRLGVQMQRQGVERSVLFAHIDPDDVDAGVDDLEDEIGRYPGMFVPFFHVNPQSPSDIRPERASRVIDESGVQFKGYGEMAFYRPPFQQTHADGPEFDSVFVFAAERNLIVMIHIRGEQVDELRRALDAHPDTTILLHGPEREVYEALPDMLRTYPNLYYTLDTATLASRPGTIGYLDILMFSEGGKQTLLDGLADPQAMAEQKAELWLPVIQAAPDRVMWGTDVAFDWHVDEDAYGALVDLSRRFIEQLPAELRDGYARGNAEQLLGEGVTFD